MTKKMTLPDQDTYTRKELAKRWGWKKSRVDAYIRTGQLKEALPPAAMRDLHRWIFYRCEESEPLWGKYSTIEAEMGSSNVWLLDLVEDRKMLEEYVGRVKQEKIIPCPEHLYKPIEDNAIEKRPDKDYNMIRYFYDLHGNALIPIDYGERSGHEICFAAVKKEHLGSLIIPLEEVLRFENEYDIRDKKEDVLLDATTPRQEERTEQRREKSDSSSKANDYLAHKPKPNSNPFMNKKSVAEFLDYKAISTIDKKVKAGKFPPPEYDGRQPKWRRDVVVKWAEENIKEKPEKEMKKADPENTNKTKADPEQADE